MNAIKHAQDEFKMKQSEFDRMMRHALGAPPLHGADKKEGATIKKKKKAKIKK